MAASDPCPAPAVAYRNLTGPVKDKVDSYVSYFGKEFTQSPDFVQSVSVSAFVPPAENVAPPRPAVADPDFISPCARAPLLQRAPQSCWADDIKVRRASPGKRVPAPLRAPTHGPKRRHARYYPEFFCRRRSSAPSAAGISRAGQPPLRPRRARADTARAGTTPSSATWSAARFRSRRTARTWCGLWASSTSSCRLSTARTRPRPHPACPEQHARLPRLQRPHVPQGAARAQLPPPSGRRSSHLPSRQALAIRMFIHFTGDLHQPLHTMSMYSDPQFPVPDGDRGERPIPLDRSFRPR